MASAPAEGERPPRGEARLAGGAAAGGGEPGGGTATADGGGSPGTADAGGDAPAAAAGGPIGGLSKVGGPSAQAQADAAEAAASKLAAMQTSIKTLETAAQTAATEAQKQKGEATTAKTTVDQAAAAVPAAPSVPAPSGADPAAKYDSAVQISGRMRKAKQDAEAKAGDAKTEGVKADTAAKIAEAKANEAKQKADAAKAQADQAKQHAQAAAEAAKQAVTLAGKSKAAAAKAKQDDPNKAALDTAAQGDAQHVTRAKAAAVKAVNAAKAIGASSAAAQKHATAAETAKTEAKQAASGIAESGSGISEKLAPFETAVSQAESQEADCKKTLDEQDPNAAEAVLQARYDALGGDAELQKFLAAEDKEFQTRVERHRVKIKDWQKDKIRELDAHKADVQGGIDGCKAMLPAFEAYYDREKPQAAQMRSNLQSLGKKAQTEPGKEVGHEIGKHERSIEGTKKIIDYQKMRLKNQEAMLETLESHYANVDAAYEAAEEYVNTMKTELDNELQMSAMTLEKKVDFLQTKPKPVRDRIQKQLEANLAATVKDSSADTMLEKVEFEEKQEFDAPPINWIPIEEQILKLASTSLEALEADDPKLAKMQEEYDAAGGDKTLFDNRVAAWKVEVAEHEKREKEAADQYLKDKEQLQKQVETADASFEGTKAALANMQSELSAARTRLATLQDEVTKSINPDGSGGPDARTQAAIQVLSREIEQKEKDIAARNKLLKPLESARDNAAKLRDQHETRYESSSDDDAWPPPKKPESKDIHAMPLRAKYAELTGNTPPA